MLILAGVSLNAIIGDNGIITNAQTANMKSGMAALEEWLQEKYVEYYDEANNYACKQELLANRVSDLFFTDGSRNFILSDGKIYYLINKFSLPKEIQTGLVAGNTKKTEYAKYSRLIDVYGVTDDLKVFYYNSEDGTSYGRFEGSKIDISSIRATETNSNLKLKDVISEELLKYGIDTGDNDILLKDASILDTLEIDNSTEITTLNGLQDLKGLKTLTLSNLTLENLSGLEGCPNLYYIFFKNCKITNYSVLSNVLNLKYLYLYLPNSMVEKDANDQITNLGNGLENASNLNKLQYFSVHGWNGYVVNDASKSSSGKSSYKSNLTSISGLSKFNNTIKNSILYLNLNDNKLTDISAIEYFDNLVEVCLNGNEELQNLIGLANTKNLNLLCANDCDLTSLSGLQASGVENFYFFNNTNLTSLAGLESCNNLKTIWCKNANISDITALNSKTLLTTLALHDSNNLVNVLTLKTLVGLTSLYLENCDSMSESQVKEALADSGIGAKCKIAEHIPSKYIKYFTAISPTLDLSYTTLGYYINSDSSEFINLKNRSNITKLSLADQINLTDDDLQGTLETLIGIQYLSLKGINNLESLNFVPLGCNNNLKYLDIRGTNEELTDLSVLDSITGLKCLIIDNYGTDFSTIQNFISLRATGASDPFNLGLVNGGLLLCNDLSEYDFSNCGAMTYMNWENYKWKELNLSGELDLSGCSRLKSVSCHNGYGNIKFPSSLKTLKTNCYQYSVLDLSLCSNLKTIYTDSGGDYAIGLINSLPAATKLKDVHYVHAGMTNNNTDFSSLDWSELTDLYVGSREKEGKCTITEMGWLGNAKKITNLTMENFASLTDYSFISNLTQLESFKCLKGMATSLDISSNTSLTTLDLRRSQFNTIVFGNVLLDTIIIDECKTSNLTNFSSQKNLTKLIIKKSGVVDLYPLRGLITYTDEKDEIGHTNLSYMLELPDNSIVDVISTTNSNIETLIKLKNAGLVKVDLTGNNIKREQATDLVSAYGSGLKITYIDDE